MIKVIELRIGNWFHDKERNRNFQVYEVHQDGVMISSHLGVETKNIQAIQLTPEILEDCGFGSCEDLGGDKTYIKQDNDNFYLVCDFVRVSEKPFNYVHQFQNIYFDLTGKEIDTEFMINKLKP